MEFICGTVIKDWFSIMLSGVFLLYKIVQGFSCVLPMSYHNFSFVHVA